MQGKKYDDKELICINVDKVYDWILKENTFDIFPTGAITFTGVTAGMDLTGAVVTCEVVPTTGTGGALPPIQILSREDREFCIDGKNVTLQQLIIQKNFTLTIIVTLPNGTIFTSAGIPVSRNERVTLCAPEGTEVGITYTELDCFISSTGSLTAGADTITFGALAISVSTCQSIQSTYPVTVELCAAFCEPRDEFPTVCPGPSRPAQCPHLFPNDGHNRRCY